MSDIRKFDTGATRDTADGKFEYDKYLSPQFINGFARYMNKHQTLPDGSKRAGDNWQQGFPEDVLVASAWRHFFDFWAIMRNYMVYDERDNPVELGDAVYGLVFNLQAIMHQRRGQTNIQRGA